MAYDRVRRQQQIRQAEGYLELGMPQQAISTLEKFGAGEHVPASVFYLRGEALRSLGRWTDAIVPLERAASGSPENIHIWLALGWCHKRNGRIDLAIESLEQAMEAEPQEALIHYNLACYWSLAGNKRHALAFLSKAFDLEADYRDLVSSEPDFDPIRSDPDFQTLVSVVV